MLADVGDTSLLHIKYRPATSVTKPSASESSIVIMMIYYYFVIVLVSVMEVFDEIR